MTCARIEVGNDKIRIMGSKTIASEGWWPRRKGDRR